MARRTHDAARTTMTLATPATLTPAPAPTRSAGAPPARVCTASPQPPPSRPCSPRRCAPQRLRPTQLGREVRLARGGRGPRGRGRGAREQLGPCVAATVIAGVIIIAVIVVRAVHGRVPRQLDRHAIHRGGGAGVLNVGAGPGPPRISILPRKEDRPGRIRLDGGIGRGVRGREVDGAHDGRRGQNNGGRGSGTQPEVKTRSEGPRGCKAQGETYPGVTTRDTVHKRAIQIQFQIFI
ncbi:hypothetical protein C8J57DRAFT_1483313 [Mycena rebaudengoi]|nr:hypothetical protein C8J57DRAFT_1483313 [Mycena rebaudengoi]